MVLRVLIYQALACLCPSPNEARTAEVAPPQKLSAVNKPTPSIAGKSRDRQPQSGRDSSARHTRWFPTVHSVWFYARSAAMSPSRKTRLGRERFAFGSLQPARWLRCLPLAAAWCTAGQPQSGLHKSTAGSPAGARWPCSAAALQKSASTPTLPSQWRSMLAYLDRVEAAVEAVKQHRARISSASSGHFCLQ